MAAWMVGKKGAWKTPRHQQPEWTGSMLFSVKCQISQIMELRRTKKPALPKLDGLMQDMVCARLFYVENVG